MGVPRIFGSALALGLLCGVLAAPARAQAGGILVLGDSITEGVGATRPLVDGLAGQIAHFATRPARSAFVPAHGFVGLNADAAALFRMGPTTTVGYTGSWRMDGGLGGDLLTLPSGSGPVGFGATPLRARSALSFEASGPAVRILYDTTKSGPLATRVAGRRKTVRLTRSAGASFRLALPPGRHSVVLSSWPAQAAFGGLVQETRSATMILGVGRSGLMMSTAVSRAESAAIRSLRPDVTVLALGTNDVLRAGVGGSGAALGRYRQGIARRGALARRTGRCVVLAPARLAFAPALVARFTAAGREQSARSGCRWSTAFARAFPDGRAALAAGWLHPDEIHPTDLGFRRLGKLIARDIGI